MAKSRRRLPQHAAQSQGESPQDPRCFEEKLAEGATYHALVICNSCRGHKCNLAAVGFGFVVAQYHTAPDDEPSLARRIVGAFLCGVGSGSGLHNIAIDTFALNRRPTVGVNSGKVGRLRSAPEVGDADLCAGRVFALAVDWCDRARGSGLRNVATTAMQHSTRNAYLCLMDE